MARFANDIFSRLAGGKRRALAAATKNARLFNSIAKGMGRLIRESLKHQDFTYSLRRIGEEKIGLHWGKKQHIGLGANQTCRESKEN